MIGDRRKFPVALVVPNYEVLTAWAQERGISGTREELVRRQEVVDHYLGLVASLTGELAQFEKIKKLALLPRELTQEAVSAPTIVHPGCSARTFAYSRTP